MLNPPTSYLHFLCFLLLLFNELIFLVILMDFLLRMHAHYLHTPLRSVVYYCHRRFCCIPNYTLSAARSIYFVFCLFLHLIGDIQNVLFSNSLQLEKSFADAFFNSHKIWIHSIPFSVHTLLHSRLSIEMAQLTMPNVYSRVLPLNCACFICFECALSHFALVIYTIFSSQSWH